MVSYNECMSPAFICALLLSLGSQKLHIKSADLRLRGVVGDSYSYVMTMTIKAVKEKGQKSWTMYYDQTLKKVDGKNFYWNTTFSLGKAKAFGVMQGDHDDLSKIDGAEMTFVQNERGENVQAKMLGQTLPGRTGANVTLPGKRVKIGDTWTSKTNIKGSPPTITYKLRGFAHVFGKDVAFIEGTFPNTMYAEQLGASRFMVDMKTGVMIAGDGHVATWDHGRLVTVEYTIEPGYDIYSEF